MNNIILVPVDFGSASQCALVQARELAEALRAELVLLHVCSVPLAYFPGVEPVSSLSAVDAVTGDATARLEQMKREVGAARAWVAVGEPVSQILQTVQELQPRMVVMGTHGRNGLARVMLGSVAEGVLRKSSSPVMTVTEPAIAVDDGVRHHTSTATATIAGTLAGAAVGVMGGPVGAVMGGLLGAAAGGATGLALDRDETARSERDEVLDRTIGVVGGTIGAATLIAEQAKRANITSERADQGSEEK